MILPLNQCTPVNRRPAGQSDGPGEFLSAVDPAIAQQHERRRLWYGCGRIADQDIARGTRKYGGFDRIPVQTLRLRTRAPIA